MNEYRIKALLEVEVECVVEAEDVGGARALFTDHLMVTASLSEIEPDRYTVDADCINELEIVDVTAEGRG